MCAGRVSLELPRGQQWQISGSLGADLTEKVSDTLVAAAAHSGIGIIKIPDLKRNLGVDYPLGHLQTRGHVNALVSLPGGGLAVGTNADSVDIYSKETVNYQQSWAKTSLKTKYAVTALLHLGGGRLAAGTVRGDVSIFSPKIPNTTSERAENWRRVRVSTCPGNVVFALAPLQGGGLAVGAGHGLSTVIYLFDAATLRSPKLPSPDDRQGYCHSQAHARILGIHISDIVAMPYGALALSTFTTWEVLLFNATALALRGTFHSRSLAYAALPLMGPVKALLRLTDGGLAVGTGERGDSVIKLFTPMAVAYGLPSYVQLRVFGEVQTMQLLPDGGIAVGTDASLVEFFEKKELKHNVQAHEALRASGPVEHIAILPDWGIAATSSEWRIDLFNASVWQGPTWVYLPTKDRPVSLLALPGAALAVGTEGSEVELFNPRVVKQGGTSWFSLPTFGFPYAMTLIPTFSEFPYSRLVVGTGAGVVHVYRGSTLVRGGSDYMILAASGPVRSLLLLDHESPLRLAAGTDAEIVDLWNESELAYGGRPYGKLMCTNPVRVMVMVPGHEALAVGTIAGTVDLFDREAIASGGLPYARLEASNTVHSFLPLMAGRLAVGTRAATVDIFESDALRYGGPPNSSLAATFLGLPVMALIPLGVSSENIPTFLLAGRAVLTPQDCAPSEFGRPANAGCASCSLGWFSFQGQEACNFRGGFFALQVALATTAFCACFGLLGLLVESGRRSSRGLFGEHCSRGWNLEVLPLLIWSAVVLFSAAPEWAPPPFQAVMTTPTETAATLTCCTILLFVLTQCCKARRRPVDRVCGTPSAVSGFSLLVLAVAASTNIAQLYSDDSSGNPLSTPLGVAYAPHRPHLRSSLALTAVALFLGAMTEASHPSVDTGSPDFFLEDTSPPCSCASTVDGSWICRLWRQLYDSIWSGLSFCRTWHGRHCILLANALFNLLSFLGSMPRATGTPRQCLLVICSFFAFCSLVLGVFSMAWVACHETPPHWALSDRHFRGAVLLKSCMLVGKSVLLAMPVTSPVQVRSLWSCGPEALCPAWCTSRPGGFCAAVQGRCACVSPERSQFLIIQAGITNAVLLLLTIADLTPFCRWRLPPLLGWRTFCCRAGWRALRTRIALLGTLGVSFAQVLIAVLVAHMPAACYMLDLRSALLIALPAIPLLLLANETRWVLETWQQNPIPAAPVWDSSGLRSLASICCASALAAARLIGQWKDGKPNNCRVSHGIFKSALVLTAMASVAAACLQPRCRVEAAVGGDGEVSHQSQRSQSSEVALAVLSWSSGAEPASEEQRAAQLQLDADRRGRLVSGASS